MKKMTITLIAIVVIAGSLLAFGRGHGMGMNNGNSGYYNADCDKGEPGMGMGMHRMGRGRELRQQGRGMHDRMGGMMYRRIFAQLDLSENQMDKLDKIKSKYQEQQIDLQAKMKKLRLQKREAIKNHNYSKAKDVLEKIADVRKTMQENRIDGMKERWGVLTADQKKKADKLVKERPYKMPYRFHNEDDNEK